MRIAKFCCMALWALSSLAQNPAEQFAKAPPDVDSALRERVTKFYQAHVDGKFRAADAFVEEASKDAFFAMDKPRCTSFQVGLITYSQDFTRAVVMVGCDTQLTLPLAGGPMPVKMPVRSVWKLVDGQWFWYAEPPNQAEVKTPFGTHKPNPELGTPASGAAAARGGAVDMLSLSKMVAADKQLVRFDPSLPGSDRITIRNGMPGAVTLSLEPPTVEGLQLQLDRTSLEQGQTAVLSVAYAPSQDRKPANLDLSIVVEPLDLRLPLRVQFAQEGSAAAGTPR
jgi:hypothetical protein